MSAICFNLDQSKILLSGNGLVVIIIPFKKKKKNLFFFSLSNADLRFQLLIFTYNYANSPFKFHVINEETI